MFEEVVTSGDETFPYGIRIFLCYRTDGFPFFLKFGQFIGSYFPVGTVLKSFCFFAQGTLLFQVFVHTFLQGLEELSLFTEELVARFAETFENLHVHFLRSETDGLPFVLKCDDFLRFALPRSKVCQFFVVDGFYDFANYGLLVKIVLFHFLQCFEMLLVTSIYGCRGSFETCPDFVA